MSGSNSPAPPAGFSTWPECVDHLAAQLPAPRHVAQVKLAGAVRTGKIGAVYYEGDWLVLLRGAASNADIDLETGRLQLVRPAAEPERQVVRLVGLTAYADAAPMPPLAAIPEPRPPSTPEPSPLAADTAAMSATQKCAIWLGWEQRAEQRKAALAAWETREAERQVRLAAEAEKWRKAEVERQRQAALEDAGRINRPRPEEPEPPTGSVLYRIRALSAQ